MRQAKFTTSHKGVISGPQKPNRPRWVGVASRRLLLDIHGFSVAVLLVLAGSGFAGQWNGPADLPSNERYPLARSVNACEEFSISFKNSAAELCVAQLVDQFSEAELLKNVPFSSPRNAMAHCWKFIEGIVPEVFGVGITAESYGAFWNRQDRYERLPVRRVTFLATNNGIVVAELEFVCRMEAHGMPERLELWLSGQRGEGAPLYLKRFKDEEPAETGAFSFLTVKALNILAGLE